MTSVSVITPTWRRHDLLFNRCITGVAQQTHGEVEHIIVSDGPDPELGVKLWDADPPVRYFELPEHPDGRHWGTPARLHGLEHATGEYIAYCDDDDMFRMNHCELLSQELDQNPEVGFVVGLMDQHSPHGSFTIGYGLVSCGNVGTPMLMHRREILDIASWGYASATEDWELVNAWIAGGVEYARVHEVTVDVWPSVFNPEGRI